MKTINLLNFKLSRLYTNKFLRTAGGVNSSLFTPIGRSLNSACTYFTLTNYYTLKYAMLCLKLLPTIHYVAQKEMTRQNTVLFTVFDYLLTLQFTVKFFPNWDNFASGRFVSRQRDS